MLCYVMTIHTICKDIYKHICTNTYIWSLFKIKEYYQEWYWKTRHLGSARLITKESQVSISQKVTKYLEHDVTLTPLKVKYLFSFSFNQIRIQWTAVITLSITLYIWI